MTMLKTGRSHTPTISSRVHIIETEIYRGKVGWRGACNKMRYVKMIRTDEPITCVACKRIGEGYDA